MPKSVKVSVPPGSSRRSNRDALDWRAAPPERSSTSDLDICSRGPSRRLARECDGDGLREAHTVAGEPRPGRPLAQRRRRRAHGGNVPFIGRFRRN